VRVRRFDGLGEPCGIDGFVSGFSGFEEVDGFGGFGGTGLVAGVGGGLAAKGHTSLRHGSGEDTRADEEDRRDAEARAAGLGGYDVRHG